MTGELSRQLVRPMLATPGELPAAAEDARWAYELKWDGVRAVGYLDSSGARLFTRNDRDVVRSYPEVGDAAGDVHGGVGDVIVDGELVTFDDRGLTSFERLQERMHVRDAATARRLAERVPVFYLVFDVLHARGRPTLDLPYTERRGLLEELAAAGLNAGTWQVPQALAGEGRDVLKASKDAGMEGIVGKRRESRYRPGRRSPDWRKIKNFRTQEVIVAGWRPGAGRRAGGVGALSLAVNDADGLRYAGGVGTGFTESMLADLGRRLAPLARRSPPLAYPLPKDAPRDVNWVTPKLVGEVVFSEWTSDGRLRHPSWRGLREDKTPGDVYREEQP